MHEPSPLDAAIARATAAEALAAEYGLALDIMDRLAGVTSEAAVAEVVLEFVQVMFGAGVARMTCLDRWGHGRATWERAVDGRTRPVPVGEEDLPACRSVERAGNGLRVPIIARGGPIGRIDILELAVPEDSARYATTVWIIAKVAAMALAGVRAAHGLVPICASCKSIRDEGGTWHQLEAWISSTSEVQLSHGLCPDCYVKAELAAGLEPEASLEPDA